MSVKAERPLKDVIEAMSEKAERPLKDAIKATFVEVPRNGMASVGPRMARVKAAPKNAKAAIMPDRPWRRRGRCSRRPRRLRECPIGPRTRRLS